jgi:hypothetical protein
MLCDTVYNIINMFIANSSRATVSFKRECGWLFSAVRDQAEPDRYTRQNNETDKYGK